MPYYHAIGQIDFDNFINSVWIIVITMTTVGFGDLVPFSVFGRIIIMMTAFWGTFIISLLILSVSQIFDLTRNQRRALHHLLLTKKAATSITAAMRYFMTKTQIKNAQEMR